MALFKFNQTLKSFKSFKIASIILICALFLFVKYIAQLFPSLIGGTLIKDFELDGLQLGILASSYYYSYSVMQIFSGWILDRFSIRIAASIAIGLMGLSLFFFAHMHNFFMMCVFRVAMGIGASFATVLYMKTAAVLTQPKTFGMVSSFLATATMLGAAAGGAPLAYLFNSLTWQLGLESVGIFAVLLAALCFLFFSKNLLQTKNPQSLSSTLDSASDVKKFELKQVFLNPQNWFLLAYSGLAFSPVVIIGGVWGTPFLVLKYGQSIQSVSYLLSVMFIGLAIGAPCWTYLSLKINHNQNRKYLMQLANGLAFIFLAFIIYAPINYQAAAICFFLLGFSVGCFMLSFQICREINPVVLLGFSFAFMNTGEGIVGSLIEPLVGALLDFMKPLHHGFLLVNFYWALSLVLTCFILAAIFLTQIKDNFKTQHPGSHRNFNPPVSAISKEKICFQ